MSEKDSFDLLEGKARRKAKENIEEYPFKKDRGDLFHILQRQLTQLNESYRNAHYNAHYDVKNEYHEMYDLMAVLYSYWIQLEWQRYGQYEYRTIHEMYRNDFSLYL